MKKSIFLALIISLLLTTTSCTVTELKYETNSNIVKTSGKNEVENNYDNEIENSDFIEISPLENLETPDNLFLQKSFIYAENSIDIFCDAQKDENEEFMYDDSHKYFIRAVLNGKNYEILPLEQVQIGEFFVDGYTDFSNDSSFIFFLKDARTASYKITQFNFDGEKLTKKDIVKYEGGSYLGSAE